MTAEPLGTSENNRFFFPVDVSKLQPGYFARANTVYRKQHQNRAIANRGSRAPVYAAEKLLDFRP
jgi:hypothetical protein